MQNVRYVCQVTENENQCRTNRVFSVLNLKLQRGMIQGCLFVSGTSENTPGLSRYLINILYLQQILVLPQGYQVH